MYPPVPYTSSDSTLSPKCVAFKQSLSPRSHGSYAMELLNTLLANYASNKLPQQDITSVQQKFPHPSLAPFFASPAWFHQALTSSLQAGTLQLPRLLPEDLSMSMPSRTSGTESYVSSKGLRPPPASPVAYKRSPFLDKSSLVNSEKERFDPLFYCQPTFYPILKDRVEKAHQSWRTSDALRLPNSPHLNETGTLVPSLIDGEIIMGFNVWGEKRLCLPHLFRFVLNDVDLKAIDEACTKLQITCTTCSPAQLTLLHSRKILPKAVSSCGLIRKSDAERLTKFIRNRVNSDGCSSPACDREDRYPPSSQTEPRVDGTTYDSLKTETSHDWSTTGRHSFLSSSVIGDSQLRSRTKEESGLTVRADGIDGCQSAPTPSEPIPVIHECFGRQLGLIHPDLYVEASSKCLECRTCHRMFAPDQFVGHTHTVTEVANLNHWGFDSTNWRCYLRLYTGRRSHSEVSNQREQRQETSDDEADGEDRNVLFCTGVQAHRRLEEFKVKFAQPIRLPGSLSAALRTVGLCASVAPIPSAVLPSASPALGAASCLPSPRIVPLKTTMSTESSVPPVSGPMSAATCPPNAPQLSAVMLPQLTLRRLWAPNDGRIKVPPPPRPSFARDSDVLPRRLHTGPPLLLHSSRVVPQTAADRYDKGFIPNVCLMPPLKVKSTSISGRYKRLSQRHQIKARRLQRTRGYRDVGQSRSRSISRHSSSSSSSRTRSASVSSTSSSSCSFDEAMKSHDSDRAISACHQTQRSTSASSTCSVRDDYLKQSEASCVAPLPTSKSRSHSWTTRRRVHSVSHRSESAHSDSVVSVYCRQLSEVKRRCRSLTVPFRPVASQVRKRLRQTSFSWSDASTPKPGKSLSITKPFKDFPEHWHLSRRRHEKSGSPSRAYREAMHRQDRAMAAAKAAQGAASRICPGLWSRHFANFNSSKNGPLELPNAREPHSVRGTGSEHLSSHVRNQTSNTPVLVTSPTKNSLPTAVLALEAIWADLVRHINEYTVAVESKCGVVDARQRLFEQFITMQTCYATHIATLMHENQRLSEQLIALRKRGSSESTEVLPKTCRTATHQSSDRDSTGRLTPLLRGASDPSTIDDRSVHETPNSQFSSARLYPHGSRKKFLRSSRSESESNLNEGQLDSRRTSDAGALYSSDCDKSSRGILLTTAQPSRAHTCANDVCKHVLCPVYSSASCDTTGRASTTRTASKTIGSPQERALVTGDRPTDCSNFKLRENHSSRMYSFGTRAIACTSSHQPEESSSNGVLRKRPITDEEHPNGITQVPAPSDSPSFAHPPSAKRHQSVPSCDTGPTMPLKSYTHLLSRL